MCRGTEEGEVTSESKTRKLGKGGEKVFSNATQAFLVAVAIGIIRNKKERVPEDTAQLIRGEYLRKDKNYNYFKRLIKSKFDARTDHEIVDLMVQFSEVGVRELYDEYHKTGDIDFVRLSKMGDVGFESQPMRTRTLEETALIPIADLIENGESDFVEFKSSLAWDYKKQQPNKEMKMVIARVVSSFMNSNGGILLIGVADDRTLLGLDRDLALLHNSYDEFELAFTNAINTYLGKVNRAYVSLKFERVDDKDVAIVQVGKSPHPVYLKCEGKKEEFYIRSGNSCQPLDISEANLYIKGHWANLG